MNCSTTKSIQSRPSSCPPPSPLPPLSWSPASTPNSEPVPGTMALIYYNNDDNNIHKEQSLKHTLYICIHSKQWTSALDIKDQYLHQSLTILSIASQSSPHRRRRWHLKTCWKSSKNCVFFGRKSKYHFSFDFFMT